MKIIVDANIVFSAILNTNGKIGFLLLNSGKQFRFIAPDFLRVEIRKHYGKLQKISGLSKSQIQEAEYQVCKNINFISEEQVKAAHWLSAEILVADIDSNDVPYVAFAKHFKCKIWSGDKKLIRGLAKKEFKNVISTVDLYKLASDIG